MSMVRTTIPPTDVLLYNLSLVILFFSPVADGTQTVNTSFSLSVLILDLRCTRYLRVRHVIAP